MSEGALAVLTAGNRFKPEYFPWKNSGFDALLRSYEQYFRHCITLLKLARHSQPWEQMATGSPTGKDHAHFYSLLRESPSSIPASIKLITMADPP